MQDVEIIKSAIQNLPPNKQEEVLEAFEESETNVEDMELLDNTTVSECPHCKSERYIKWGTKNNKQRYRCKECKRTFCNTTGTVLNDIRKSCQKVIDLLKLSVQGMALRKIADKLDIALRTAFEWRHKLTSHFTQYDQLSGIVEVDETYVNHSQKGNKNLKRDGRERAMNPGQGISRNLACIVTAQDQNGNTVLKYSGKSRPSIPKLNYVLGDNVDTSNTVLCTDGSVSYPSFCRQHNIEHEVATSQNSPFTLNHINSLHQELQNWLDNFKGIATKYLDSYLQLFKLHRDNKISI